MCQDQSRADTLFRNASKMETTISKMYHIRISFRAATAALLLATGDVTSLAADAALLLATGDVATRSLAAAAALLLATGVHIAFERLGVAHQHLTA